MRIISKFKDYYDGVAAVNREDLPLYKRLAEEHRLKLYSGDRTPEDLMFISKLAPALKILKRMPSANNFDKEIIGFCGKIYPVYDKCKSLDEIIAKARGFAPYPYKSLRAWLDHFDNATTSIYRNEDSQLDFTLADLNYFFNNLDSAIGDKIFIDLGLPAFSLREDNEHSVVLFKTNPCLKDYDFFKIFDAYSAYQELDLYLGNNLAQQASIEAKGMTEKLKAETHGYDEWSFRRHSADDKKSKKRKDREDKVKAEALKKSSEIKEVKDEWAEALKIEE